VSKSITQTEREPQPSEDWLLPDTNLPKLKLKKNAAGGYRIVGLGVCGQGGTVEDWLAAVRATPDVGWSGDSGVVPGNMIPRSRLEDKRKRQYRKWAMQRKEELKATAQSCEGLTSYEVAAFIARSTRSARRFLAFVKARRQMVGPCFGKRWTGRYVF